MKTQSVSTLIALASSLQLAAATGFGSSGSFSCPSNTNNECNPQQQSGYDWSSLTVGSSFSSYGGIGFSGWGCANSFGKRDALAKRTFANTKCITGSAQTDKSKCSSFSCGANTDVKKFSVTEMHISVEFDCDLEFHYEMPDKSTCKQTAGCSTSGSIVKNSQCGGATGVTVVYPPQKPGKGTGKSGCDIGIHSIGFDCSPPSSTSVRSSTTTRLSATKATSTHVESTTTGKPSKPTTTPASSPAASSVASSSVASSSVGSSAAPSSVPETSPASSAAGSSTSVVQTTSVGIPLSSLSSFTTLPSSSAPATTSVPPQKTDFTTVVVTELTTTCPFTSIHTTAGTTSTEIGTTVSTIRTTVTSTVCTKCQGPKPTTTFDSSPPAGPATTSSIEVGSSAASTQPGSPAGTSSVVVGSSAAASSVVVGSSAASTQPGGPVTSTSVGAGSSASSTTPSGPAITAPGVPSVLPQCMNTWNFIVGCVDNTDSSCYCPSADFVNNVFGCISAHGADAATIASAASYFQGICAPHIPQNPAIITGCPSSPSSPPAATVPASGNSGASITSAPAAPPAVTAPVAVTTIVVASTYVVPCVESTGVSSGLVIPSSSTTTTLSTTLTVPQVVFSTPAAAPTGTATAPAPVLVVGTPAPVPAQTTPASGNSGSAATTIATVPIPAATGSSGNATTSSPSLPLQANSGSSNGVAIGSILGAALLAVFAL